MLCYNCNQEKERVDFYTLPAGAIRRPCKQCFHEWYIARYVPKEPIKHSPRICIYCAEEYIPKHLEHGRNKYCSRWCKDRAKKDELITARLAAKPDRFCIWCSNSLSKETRSDAKFCSATCNDAAHQCMRSLARRKGESKREAYLSLRSVLLERDGNSCSLCSQELLLQTEHPDPSYASIDHTVPLAQDGTNDIENLKLAHLVCNLRKRDQLVS